MAAADAKLAAALKLAKSATKEAPLLFAMVPKGNDDGAIIVSKMKINSTDITQAKNKCGGKTVLSGRCFMEDGKLVFEMGKDPPATMAKALKEIIKRDTELIFTPLPRFAQDMVEHAPVAPEAPSVPPQPPTPISPEAVAGWQAARVQIVNAIRKVATVVAKTKDEEAGKVAVMLEGIVKNLTPNPASPEQVTDLERYLREDKIVAAAEQVPAAIGALRIREPLLEALQQLKSR